MTETNTTMARDLLGLVAAGGMDGTAQAAALLTAATVVIEREVGTAMAEAALAALLEPTVQHWRRHTHPAPAPKQHTLIERLRAAWRRGITPPARA